MTRRSDPRRARKLAEQCFALARSTTFAAERETAIARGIGVAEAAGLSLDRFDIPGVSQSTTHTPNHALDPDADFDEVAAFRPKPLDQETLRRMQADLAERQRVQQQWEDDVDAGRRSILECSRLMFLLHLMVHRWEIAIGSVVGRTGRPIWVIHNFERPKYGNARDLYAMAKSNGI